MACARSLARQLYLSSFDLVSKCLARLGYARARAGRPAGLSACSLERLLARSLARRPHLAFLDIVSKLTFLAGAFPYPTLRFGPADGSSRRRSGLAGARAPVGPIPRLSLKTLGAALACARSLARTLHLSFLDLVSNCFARLGYVRARALAPAVLSAFRHSLENDIPRRGLPLPYIEARPCRR